jgi:superfamily I DNA and/or RNA helicase
MIASALDLARAAEERTLDLVLREGQPLVVIDSPPGAGKTRLVESIVATAVQHVGLRVAVAAARNEQTYDILRRLATGFRGMSIQALYSRRRGVPQEMAGVPGIGWQTDPRNLQRGPGVVVATVAKFRLSAADLGPNSFDLLVCDEAYQVGYREFHPLLMLAPQVVPVGDPGQLEPLVRADVARFEAAPFKVHWPAPKELLRRFSNAPVVPLPVSVRLLQDTVNLIQPSFYPSLMFRSAVTRAERRLALRARGLGSQIDRALDQLVSGASVVSVVLPPRDVSGDDVDDELAETCAAILLRLLERGPRWEGQRALTAADIGCADPHVRSGALIRRELLRRGIAGVMVDTPEIWQGLQRPIMVVKHPLSGVSRLGEFPLTPGRLCVMLSRHQLGCIVVTRDGIAEALDGHQHDSESRPAGAENPQWSGWLAHRELWSRLSAAGRLVRAA